MKSGESGAIRSVCGGQAHLYRASQVTWHHLSTRLPGTNRLSLVFAFDATWHRECRPSARGGERSKTTGSSRSLYGGNLTVTARGSEPVSPTVGVENRYSVWPQGPVFASPACQNARAWQPYTRGGPTPVCRTMRLADAYRTSLSASPYDRTSTGRKGGGNRALTTCKPRAVTCPTNATMPMAALALRFAPLTAFRNWSRDGTC